MSIIRTPSKVGDGGTVIAVDKDKAAGQALVKWTLNNLFKGNNKSSFCVIIHVITHETQSSKEGGPSLEHSIQQLLLPCLGYCARKGITAKEIIIHDLDVPSAIVDFIVKNEMTNVVVGASHRNVLIRKFKEADVPSGLLKSAPDFCSVYVISKGKPQTIRVATRRIEPTKQTAHKSASNNSSSVVSQASYSSNLFSTGTVSSTFSSFQSSENSAFNSFVGSESSKSSLDSFTSLESAKNLLDSFANSEASKNLLDSFTNFDGFKSPFESSASLRSSKTAMDSFTSLESSQHTFVLKKPEDLEAEMNILNLQLKKTMDIYNSACDEAEVAREKVDEVNRNAAPERSLEEARSAEDAATAFAEVERKKTRVATEAVHIAERVAEIETQKRRLAELRASHEASEEDSASVQGGVRYRRYSIKEIEAATDHFNNKHKIGEGGYGPVYKGLLNQTTVAIKILRPDISQGLVQFQLEVEILSSIRHPHMVLLVGACPEYGCLVYEYMDNGSLEDCLACKGDAPPIPWRARFRIAAEIATALLFLHQRRPEPLVHRDLKPANILLDRNYVSKIGDVGLARLVPASVADAVTQYRETAAAGTFCYIDPEYQQTGMLGVKSDVYSLGVMLLQIITGRPPMGLSYQVEEAIDQGVFAEVLDPLVRDWPVHEALSFARLALRCCEMRKRDRPDLATVILPELNRLRDLGIRDDGGGHAGRREGTLLGRNLVTC